MMLHNKTVLVTGGNAGIGIWTVIGAARLGAHVIMVARSAERGEAALALARQHAHSDKIDLLVADLASQHAIHALCAEIKARYPTLDVLINNAAVIPGERHLTVDGFEEQFAVNHLAYMTLTLGLLDLLRASASARIVNVSSQLHANGQIVWDDLHSATRYDGWQVYCNTKLMNVLFTMELARRLAGTAVTVKVTVNALHPGVIETNLSRDLRRASFRGYQLLNPAAEHGAETSLYLASSPEVEGVTGRYFDNRREKAAAAHARDVDAAQRLWEVSLRLIDQARLT
jgi:retinol dehydrogenase 12